MDVTRRIMLKGPKGMALINKGVGPWEWLKGRQDWGQEGGLQKLRCGARGIAPKF